MGHDPRVRVSAVLRWHGRMLLCRHVKDGRDAWLLPGGGVHTGESLLEALDRELAEEVGLTPPRFEGPIAIVDSISPKESHTSKHVVHIIFAGELNGSLDSVASQDNAVRGHRLFGTDDLRSIVLHPPIQHFLEGWQSGDPAIYLGSLWIP